MYSFQDFIRLCWIEFFNDVLGMEGVDKEKVQRIVYEMSKGSKYFENEEKREAYMKRKIESMRMQLAKLTPHDVSNYQKVYISPYGEYSIDSTK